MKNLPPEIKVLKRIKERLNKLMSEHGTPLEIRSNALYENIIRDEALSVLFPDQKTFNQFLRRQHSKGVLKQIIPNYRVDTSDYRFYQWYSHRAPNQNQGQGKNVISSATKLKYNSYGLKNLSANQLKFRKTAFKSTDENH